MSDSRNDRAYKKMLERQAANVARNEVEGRSMQNFARDFQALNDAPVPNRADTLSDVVDKAKVRHNLENTRKVADGFDPRISPLVRNNKGFAKLLPMLGLGGTALAASSIFNKAQAGDIPGAAMEAADEASDYIPGMGTAKMALQSDALGEGEEEELKKLEAQNRMQQMQNPESRRFQKIKDLLK